MRLGWWFISRVTGDKLSSKCLLVTTATLAVLAYVWLNMYWLCLLHINQCSPLFSFTHLFFFRQPLQYPMVVIQIHLASYYSLQFVSFHWQQNWGATTYTHICTHVRTHVGYTYAHCKWKDRVSKTHFWPVFLITTRFALKAYIKLCTLVYYTYIYSFIHNRSDSTKIPR